MLQSFYGVPVPRVVALMRDLIALPGLMAVDDCPWKKVIESWPEQLPGFADAASVAVATANHYDAFATFDQPGHVTPTVRHIREQQPRVGDYTRNPSRRNAPLPSRCTCWIVGGG